jgi:ferric-dicitrate binding protein FerR (iron transport regulator)
MPEDRIIYLLHQLFKNKSTPAEKEELALWIEASPNNEEWESHLKRIWEQFDPQEAMDETKANELLEAIINKDKETRISSTDGSGRPLGMRLTKWLAAAVITGLLITSIVFYFRKTAPLPKTDLVHAPVNGIKPGGNKAILTLANGSVIVLDSMGNGSLGMQGHTKIVKLDNNQLVYKASKSGESPKKALYNTIATPNGGQYKIVLPDGSTVWLNAASSIRFPISFTGKDREIEMRGEAYFEIVKQPGRPFIIKIMAPSAMGGKIEVLGTSFNISAYQDESAVSTTLLEGSLRWQKGNESIVMEPGERVIVNEKGKTSLLKGVNTDEVIAWKNGLFNFEASDIQIVMREIARWYDIEVYYKAPVSAHFMGTISRQADISEVLRMLESTGEVHFSVEGRKVYVSP